jgi:hypothetical protein
VSANNLWGCGLVGECSGALPKLSFKQEQQGVYRGGVAGYNPYMGAYAAARRTYIRRW